MKNYGHLIFIEIELFTVEFLKTVLFLAIEVYCTLGIVLVRSLFAPNDPKVFNIIHCMPMLRANCSLKVFIFPKGLG